MSWASIFKLIKASKVGKNSKGVAKSGALGKTAKLGTKGGVTAFIADKAFDFASNVISNLLKGGGKTSSSVSSLQSQGQKEKKTKAPPASRQIILKKHDYPNTYRVQLNQLSNEINYAIKIDKASNRKTNTKYQSVLCKKILKKIAMHTNVQNDLLVNEIHNLMSADPNISDKTKKTFIENMLEQIKPKTKDGFSETFANADTLKELKSINKTQIRIYRALKDLSLITIQNAKTNSAQSQKTIVSPFRSRGYSISKSGGGGGALTGLLGALAGGALGSIMLGGAGLAGLYGGDSDAKNDGETDDDSSISAALSGVANYVQTKLSSYVNKSLTPVRADTQKPKLNSELPVNEKTTNTPEKNNTPEKTSHLKQTAVEDAEKIKYQQALENSKKSLVKHSKFLTTFDKIFGAVSVKVAIKLLNVVKSTGIGLLIGGLQVWLVKYQLDHIDEYLGHPAGEEEKAALVAIATIENVPVVGTFAAILDMVPVFLKLGGMVINGFVVPGLKKLVSLYENSDPFIKSLIDKFPLLDYVFKLGCLSLSMLITALESIGGLLEDVDPDFFLNLIADASRTLERGAESAFALESSIVKHLESQGLIEKSDWFFNSKGNAKITDWDKVRKLTYTEIDALNDYEGLNDEDRNKLTEIKREKSSKYQLAKYKNMTPKEADLEVRKDIARERLAIIAADQENNGLSLNTHYDIKYLYEKWKELVKEFKDIENENYLYCPPKRVFIRMDCTNIKAGVYYIFLFGTVAKVIIPNVKELRNKNIEIIGHFQLGDTLIFDKKPAYEDTEAFDYFYSEPQYIKDMNKSSVDFTHALDKPSQNTSLGNNIIDKPTKATSTGNTGNTGNTSNTGNTVAFGSNTRGNTQDSKTVKIPPSATSQIVWNKLINYGFTKEQTAGIMGNIMRECSMKADSFNSAGGGIGAYGLCQWRGNRQRALNDLAQKRGVPRSDPALQVDFIMQELRDSERKAYNAIKQAKTVEQAACAWAKYFERCGRYEIEFPTRTKFANAFYKKFSNNEEINKNDQQETEETEKTEKTEKTESANTTGGAEPQKTNQDGENLSQTNEVDKSKNVPSVEPSKDVSEQTVIPNNDQTPGNDNNKELVKTPTDAGALDKPSNLGNNLEANEAKTVIPNTEKTEKTESANTTGSAESAESTQNAENTPSKDVSIPQPVSVSKTVETAEIPQPQTAPQTSTQVTDSSQKQDAERTEQIQKDRNKVIRAAEEATARAGSHSKKKCATYVSDAMIKAGFKVRKQESAYMYHTNGELKRLGFGIVHSGNAPYSPMVGDICVINKFGGHVHGHICIFNGRQWVSDFKQRSGANIYPDGAKNEGIWYYRYRANDAVPDQNTAYDVDSGAEISASANTGYAESRSENFAEFVHQSSQNTFTKGLDGSDPDNKYSEQRKPQNMDADKQAMLLNEMRLKQSGMPIDHNKVSNSNAFFTFPIFDMPLGAV